MEQDCGGGGGGGGGGVPAAAAGLSSCGSFISLNEHEHRYYSGLHLLCQQQQQADSSSTGASAAGSGRLSAGKVAELFKTSQLPPEALHQVTEVCGAKRLGYFGTAQFYIALKLLAAAQSGLPVRLESITANLPLPRFVGLKNETELRYVTQSMDALQGGPAPGVCGGPGPAWTPADRGGGGFRHLEPCSAEKQETSPCSSPPRSPSSSYRGCYPYGQQRNNSTPSGAQRNNGTDGPVAYESKHCSRPVVHLDQQHSSPSSYGIRAAAEPSPSSYGIRAAADQCAVPRVPSVERLDQRGGGGEEYSDDDPWRITEEQQEYYTNQFRSLQPDLGALILGTVAKNFFTKSKLPIPELSHIWELSDVDRDGALTFSEFCTAFHLIVARKNGYPLPETLPPTLRPPESSDHQDTGHIPHTPESAEPLIVFDDAEPRPSQLDRGGVTERLQPALGPPSSRPEMKEDPCTQQDLVSSPQDKHTALQFGAFSRRPEPPHDLDPQMKMKSRPRSYSSTSIDDAMKKAENEPPTPPPRPQKKSHSRASSLDLNKLFQQGGAQGIKSGWLPPPPALPPRPSVTQAPHFLSTVEKTPQKKKVSKPNFADFSRFREEDERAVKPQEESPLRRGAGPSTEDLTAPPPLQDSTGVSLNSHVPQKPLRRKYRADSLEATPTPNTPFNLPAKPAQKLLSRQKREIQLAIRKNKETNAVLTRLNSELQQQLKEVHQERITLESQLDVLRPLAST